ncbi:MAG: 4-hydroxythreonine-4-phosphate dehydrogenase PdxA [Paramuribaculum sp.]|nr:4-hydroxythreonine-4-phosphate dehydrogenase PdxA [Paramuribaculum sp.]
MADKNIRVGITQGDINGVGYEVILKALEDNRILELCTPVVYGSGKIAAFYRKASGMAPIQWHQCDSVAELADGDYNMINVVPEDIKVEPGVESKAAGEAAFVALERAVADLRAGNIDVLVTAPISKKAIQSEQFTFPGHTEYLESSLGDGSHALMILCSDNLRVALVTTHTPVAQLSAAITKEAVLEKIMALNLSLEKDFGIGHPRIAVLALNPHAGERGLLGNEEQEHIIPAIAEAQAQKIHSYGPYAADGFWGSGAYTKFDGILAMYHDQGLAPFKSLAMNAGVNFTAGLEYVRTSPDHGTGFDIAGQGVADAESMRQAIYTAIDVWRSRRGYARAHRNPLRKQYHEKNKADNVVLDLTKDE